MRLTKMLRRRKPDPDGMNRLVIAGLRNPGAKYAGSRHNSGAEVVESVASRHGITFKRAPKSIRAEIAEGRIANSPVVLVLPTVFMNESGQAISPLLKYFSVEPRSLVVVHDDIDLPFARLRVQFGRGAGGNNGVRSVIGSLGTQEFWRLKCGVGRPPGSMDPADFVLRPFASKERPDVDLMIQYGVDVLDEFVAAGGDAASQLAGEVGKPA